MTASAGVVAAERGDFVEEEQTPEVGELAVDRASEPRLECGFDRAGEAGASKRRCQLGIQVDRGVDPRKGGDRRRDCHCRPDVTSHLSHGRSPFDALTFTAGA
jgi:hypothetical protein